jgi:hypothetical protein
MSSASNLYLLQISLKSWNWFWITIPKNHFADFFWPNAFWPKTILPYAVQWKSILPKKVIWPNAKLIKRSFYRKYLENSYLTENQIWKTNQMTEMTFDRKFIWPKSFSERWLFGRKVIWPKVHLTESFFFEKWLFDRKSFWQRVKQPWFIIRIGKAILIFVSASDHNRVWLPRCLRRRQVPCLRW